MDCTEIMVTGDCGISRYVYIESLPDKQANLREAWVDAKDFVPVEVPDGAADVARCLGCEWLSTQTDDSDEPRLESIYMLTNPSEVDGNGNDTKPWKVARAIVAGQRQVTFEAVSPDQIPDGVPLVVVDFHLGWVNSNHEYLAALLAGRPWLIRTHDPASMVGAGTQVGEDFWQRLRRNIDAPGVWFSPWQDIADGGLRAAGSWKTVRDTILHYLRREGGRGLCDEDGNWAHHVVVQVRYDGALVLSPPDRQTVLRFPSDQPGSFTSRQTGTVVGGGICIAASLAEALCGDLTHQALVDRAKVGLARARALVTQGYADPPVNPNRDHSAPTDWHPFPDRVLGEPLHVDLPIIREPVEGSIERALQVLTTDARTFERMMSYRMGKLYTCEPAFAEQLIRLTERIQSHLTSDERDVMSLAILGGPGSGKSFAARQLLEAVGGDLEAKEFNVSQFTSEQLLVDAFRQVQQISLQGHVPFVLWDEFDSVNNGQVGGWLSRFLMPMEDGEFWDGGERARLGKCVFVFVGSTWSTREEFDQWIDLTAQADDADAPTGRVAPGLKGPDFQSRLDRIIQVPDVDIPARSPDSCPLLTRALMIRLAMADADIRQIDRDVAEFLLTTTLRHGVRSLRAIIDASQLGRTDRFCAFHLPPAEMMQVHVASTADIPQAREDTSVECLPLQWARDDVRVGVTGHRYLAEIDTLRESARRAFEEIEAWFEDRKLTVLSPLAEGADRLVADVGLERGAELVAPLPMPRDSYITDFDTAESRQHFDDLIDEAEEVIELPEAETRRECYTQVGEWILDEADVLIAVWDGRPAQGEGGTADIARRALDRDMPVLHIRAGNRKPGTSEPTSLGEQQGKLTIHNLQP